MSFATFLPNPDRDWALKQASPSRPDLFLIFLACPHSFANVTSLFENSWALKKAYEDSDSMSGNPVRFGDGCATVLGHELQFATG